MVFQRRRKFVRKNTYNRNRGRQRMMKRQMLKPKIGGQLRQPVHYFTRFQNYGTIQALNATTITFGVVFFELANVPGFAEFTAMYDFFKINAVSVRFIPQSNVNLYNDTGQVQVVASQFYNRIVTVVDYNDRTVPTSLNDLRQYGNCKVGTNNRVHKRFFHPKPTLAVDEDSGSGTSYGLAQMGKIPWIATGSDQAEWYGIKYGIEHANPGGTVDLYKVEVKLYLSFKGRI